MLVYCDSSALLKRVLDEAESEPLDEWLATEIGAGSSLTASALAWVEVNRAIRKRRDLHDPASWIVHATRALSGVEELPMSRAVLSLAQRVAGPTLRTLDAVHLATAILSDADVVVTYDLRLLQVATEMGLATIAPGETAPAN